MEHNSYASLAPELAVKHSGCAKDRLVSLVR